MILVFSGREHHTKKLRPVFDELSKNYDVRWLVNNNAINIDPPLEYTAASGDKFIHAYTAFRPGDDALVDELVNKTLKHMPIVPGVAPWWQTYSVRELAELFVSYSNIMPDVEAVLILHSNNFFAKMLAFVAQSHNVPVFAFQEGVLRDRDQETMNKQTSAGDYVTKLFVWGKNAKKQYIAAGLKNSQLVISGPMHLDRYMNMSNQEALALTRTDTPTVLFAPTLAEEYVGNISQDASFLHHIATSLGYHFIFRPHPFELEAGTYNHLNLNTYNAPDNLVLCRNGNTIVVGQHSTIMNEAVALGAPIIEYQQQGLPIIQPVSVAFTATQKTFPDLLATIQEKLADFDVRKLKKFVKDEFGELGNATNAVVMEIKKYL